MPSGRDVLWWIEKYEKRLGSSFFEDWDIGFYPLCHIFEDGSLFTYTVCDGRLEVGPTSCNIWKAWAKASEIAKELGFKEVGTVTPRNPRAYCRLVKSRWTDTKIVDGKEYYYMIKEVD